MNKTRRSFTRLGPYSLETRQHGSQFNEKVVTKSVPKVMYFSCPHQESKPKVSAVVVAEPSVLVNVELSSPLYGMGNRSLVTYVVRYAFVIGKRALWDLSVIHL